MIFGKKIKELREKRGLVQRQLSAALEIDTPMYSKIERGERIDVISVKPSTPR